MAKTFLSKSKGWVSEKLNDCAVSTPNGLYLFDNDQIKFTYHKFSKQKFIKTVGYGRVKIRREPGYVDFWSVITSDNREIPLWNIYNVEKI